MQSVMSRTKAKIKLTKQEGAWYIMSYIIVLIYMDTEETREIGCTKANAKFSEPRILAEYSKRNDVLFIYKVFQKGKSECEVLYEKESR